MEHGAEIDYEDGPFKASIDVVGHQEEHAELFQRHQLHVALGHVLLAEAHRQAPEQRLWIDFGHVDVLFLVLLVLLVLLLLAWNSRKT